MAVSQDTFSNLSGAVNDLFAGFGTAAKAGLQAKGLQITAAGTRISAQSTRLNAEGLRIKAAGDIAEAENYDLAAALARQNKTFTEASTRIQQFQADRQATLAIGGQRAAFAGAGFAASGSALDILRDSASQAALQRGVLGMQGAITEAGFEEQAKSFDTMSAAGRAAAAGEYDIASKTEGIANQQDLIAAQQDQLAAETRKAGTFGEIGDFISSAIKGAAMVATLL